MNYMVLIHAAEEGGWWAEFPSLPGCHTQGETVDEVLERAPDAVASHVEALTEDGLAVPHEQLIFAMVHVPERAAASH